MSRDRSLQKYAESLFNEKRFVEAFMAYEQLAASGDPQGHAFLGWMYYEGLGVERNEKEALRWFNTAAQLGSKVGAFYCGKYALIEQQYEDAFRWLQASAKQDYGPSLLWLGLIFVRGLGRPSDLKKGVGYLRRAAGTGNFPAKRELAVLMMKGKLGWWKVPLGLVLLPYATLVAIVEAMAGNYSEKLMG